MKKLLKSRMAAPGVVRAGLPTQPSLLTASLAVMLLMLGACSSTAPYKAPMLEAGRLSTLPSAAATDKTQPGVPAAMWWAQFNDAQLDALVETAWQNNFDIRVSAARLSISREQAQMAQAARLPSANLEASSSHARLAAIESRGGTATTVNPLQWQAVLSWELDLFGRVRHSIEAAQASAEESSALRHDLRRLILSHVVETYLELRGAQMLSATIQQQLDNQASTLKLVRERESAGSVAPAERMRVEAQLQLVSSRLPSLLAQERAARNRLATLTGQKLDTPQIAMLDRPAVLRLPETLVTDEPARLLLRRPDVRAAERALAVAAAREGIAQAEMFPRISLLALLGTSGVAGDWLSSESVRGRFGAGATWTLFDGGARRTQVRAAGAGIQAAQANFEKVVAVALEETDTAVWGWGQVRRRNAELNIAQGLGQESARLARIRYQEGAESLLGVLEAERTALAIEEQLVMSKRDLAALTARCYIAMAGGFDGVDTGTLPP